MTSGEQIKRARERAGMDQVELARLVGVSRQTISSWETGAATPKNKLGRLVEVLGLGEEVSRAGPGRRDLDSLSDAELAIRLLALVEELDEVTRAIARRTNPRGIPRSPRRASESPTTAYPGGVEQAPGWGNDGGRT